MTAKGWVALWAVYVIWGSTYLGIELAGETIPPVFAAGVRFLLAGGLMAGWVAIRRGRSPFRVERRELASAVLVGVLLLGANAMLFVAERRVPIGLASLLIASVPLWIVLMRTVTGDRPRRVALVGVGTGFGGIALLVRPGGHASFGGIVLVLGSASIWATGSFLSSRLPLPPDAFVATAIEMLAGGALLLPLGLLLAGDESVSPAAWSGRSVVGLVYLVLIGSLVGYTAYVWLLGHVAIGTVATYAYVNPVVAVALGALIAGEAVTATTVIGGLITVVAVVIVVSEDGGRRRPPLPDPPEAYEPEDRQGRLRSSAT